MDNRLVGKWFKEEPRFGGALCLVSPGSTKRHHDLKTARKQPFICRKSVFSAKWAPGRSVRPFHFRPGARRNHLDVVGSSPTGGAKQRASLRRVSLFGFPRLNQTPS